MASTIAFVTETHADGHATVTAERGQGCGSCSAAAQCHGGSASRTHQTTALNQAGAKVGDRVMLTVASGTLLSRMAVLYLIPVAGMLIGAFSGTPATGGINAAGDSRSILLGLTGFAAGFALSVFISRIWSARRPVLPVISRIVNIGGGPASRAAGPPTGCSCAHR